MNRLMLVLAILAAPYFAHARGKSLQFQLEWVYKNVPLHIQVGEASDSVADKVATTGVVDDLKGLSLVNPIDDAVFTVEERTSKYMYLFAKNNTDHEIVFSVAPHETNPVEYSLGFAFHCLCNGHVYRVPPGKYWYRIVELHNGGIQKTSDVIHLKHTVFAVKEPKEAKK